MALRATARARQAHLSGGISDVFDGATNAMQLVFKTGAVAADVDSISGGSTIATLIAADEGASNVNGTYADPSDDATTASAAIRSNITGNATAAHDYDSAADDAGHCEVFVGAGRTAADKMFDFTVGSANSTAAPQDLQWDVDAIANGGLLTVTAVTLTQT